jgi:hypothetical protein
VNFCKWASHKNTCTVVTSYMGGDPNSTEVINRDTYCPILRVIKLQSANAATMQASFAHTEPKDCEPWLFYSRQRRYVGLPVGGVAWWYIHCARQQRERSRDGPRARQQARYLRWSWTGHLSSVNTVLDIEGGHTPMRCSRKSPYSKYTRRLITARE